MCLIHSVLTRTDKAAAADKETAHTKFQEVAFAYAILSDPHRRSRYNTTGNTAESLDDDFDWADFFRAQKDAVTPEAIKKFKEEYQGSEEETTDLLAAYTEFKGDMDTVYEMVMCSDEVEDDERFRTIIDQAIADKKVKGWKKYTAEKPRTKAAREKRAAKEAKEAEAHAKELKLGSNKSDLGALIQARQKLRAGMFDSVYAKYGGDTIDEPPEEAFAATAARQAEGKKRKTESKEADGRKKTKATGKGKAKD